VFHHWLVVLLGEGIKPVMRPLLVIILIIAGLLFVLPVARCLLWRFSRSSFLLAVSALFFFSSSFFFFTPLAWARFRALRVTSSRRGGFDFRDQAEIPLQSPEPQVRQ
jgi:hypothetical protein